MFAIKLQVEDMLKLKELSVFVLYRYQYDILYARLKETLNKAKFVKFQVLEGAKNKGNLFDYLI